MKKCGFCDKEAASRIVKIKNGFYTETHFCEDHIRSFENGFLAKMENIDKTLRELLLFNSPDDLKKNIKDAASEEEGIEKCTGCGMSGKTFMSTGFPCCGECFESFFKFAEETLSPSPDSSGDFEICDPSPIKEPEILLRKMNRAAEKQDFVEAARLKKILESVSNDKSGEKPEKSEENLPYSEGD